ncbi:MAG: DNA polymerase III subunit gamma/tau [Candidatus Omnitrophica bacterium]|nr:DNA polymerase III subunit gamma/tau [Candidatus Omnitrophota bacterium]
MSYLVFARKYRPRTFLEILGQGPIVTTLTNAIRQHRIAHAYLFSGPRGTGKTSTARIFAKGLNCVEGPTPTPCLKCDRCQGITEGRSLDVLEIDGASNRGIDQIRALREHSRFTPAAGPFKVYIIDEVHQITAEGFNALLKTLEEPPAHVLFILATTAPHKVPGTILSRCQRYDFKRLPLSEIAAKIKSIAEEEKLKITEEAVVGIARAAAGSLRDAESILDQVAAFSGGKIRAEDVQTLLGTIDEEIFTEAVAAIQAREPVRLLKLVADAVNDGTDLTQWCLSFLGFLRNLLLIKVGADRLGLEELTPESIQKLSKLAEGLTIEQLTGFGQVLTSAIEMMRRVGEPRIPLEMALVRLSRGETVAAVAELLDRLEELDQRLQRGVPDAEAAGRVVPAEPQPQPQPQPKPESRPAAASQPASSRSSSASVTLEQVAAAWPNLLEELHRQKASTAAYLNEAGPVSVDGADPARLVVGFPKEFKFHQEALDRPAIRQVIDSTLSALLGCPVRCAFEIVDQLPARAQAAAAEQQGPPSPGKPNPASVLLNSVVDLFEGRVLPGEG